MENITLQNAANSMEQCHKTVEMTASSAKNVQIP